MEHTLSVNVPSEPIYIDADLVRLSQVFLNLLNNAAKYSERGGEIQLTAESHDGMAIVTVKDQGIGIAPDQLPAHL
jgi:signal transduction histidine kinase